VKRPHGIIPAMVTPLTKGDEINEAALRRLTRKLIDGGVHGLFAIGSQGEFWAFTAKEKQKVWEVVVQETAGKVPVYAGSAAVTTREAVELTRLAEKCGVDFLSVLTPFFVEPNEEELYQHYRAVAAATKLPLLLYTNPARTGVKMSPRLVRRLAEIDNIVGIKDSSGDFSLTMEYIAQTPEDFAVVMGRDTLIFAALMAGAKGSIAATANVCPELVVRIYDHVKAGKIDAALEAQKALAPLRLAFTWGTFPVVIKEALDLMGMEGGPCRAPVGPLSGEQREKLRVLLRDMKMI
jgi:4-hydroxy-tetrahydrodipicolinate synthase